MRKKSTARGLLALLLTTTVGLNADAMEPNMKKEVNPGVKVIEQNADPMIDGLDSYDKKDFDNLKFKLHESKSKVPVAGNDGSIKFGDFNIQKDDQIESDNIQGVDLKPKNNSESKAKTFNNGEPAIKLNYPFNLLVVADTKERMQKVTSILHKNNLSYCLADLKQNLNNYQSGSVYQAADNPNVNILCVTLDDFINNSFDNYDWDFICQNTSKIFYVFKCESYKDKKCFDALQKFYHKFNKHWCGNDVAYDENYEPDLNTVATSNFKGPVLEKGRNDWFEYVRVKRGQSSNHRYIYFILDNNELNYPFNLEHYISKMPDARSIKVKELDDNFNIKVLFDLLFTQYKGSPQKVIPFNSDIIKKKNAVVRWFNKY